MHLDCFIVASRLHLSKFYTLILLLRIGVGVGWGWLEKWGIKLSHLSTEVEVEVEDELGNILNMCNILTFFRLN